MRIHGQEKKKRGPNMNLPVCSVAMTVDHNKDKQLNDMLRDGIKESQYSETSSPKA